MRRNDALRLHPQFIRDREEQRFEGDRMIEDVLEKTGRCGRFAHPVRTQARQIAEAPEPLSVGRDAAEDRNGDVFRL